MDVDEVLREVASLGGVVHAFVFDAAGQIVAAGPPRPDRSPGLAAAARAAFQTLSCLAALGERPGELDLSFEEGRVVVRPAGDLATLAIVCQPSINALMLRLRTAEAVAEIAAAMERTRREAASPRLASRVKGALETALGEKAGKFLALASAAGESPEKLGAAGSEAVRFAKLFVGKERAEALRSQLRSILGRDL